MQNQTKDDAFKYHRQKANEIGKTGKRKASF